MSKPIPHYMKGNWFVCLKHNRILFERVTCPGKPKDIIHRDVSGGTCEPAGDFNSEIDAQRFINKNEIADAGDDVR